MRSFFSAGTGEFDIDEIVAFIDTSSAEDVISPTMGSGPCKASDCNCSGYKPNTPKNDYCRVCGHSWWMHKDARDV